MFRNVHGFGLVIGQLRLPQFYLVVWAIVVAKTRVGNQHDHLGKIPTVATPNHAPSSRLTGPDARLTCSTFRERVWEIIER